MAFAAKSCINLFVGLKGCYAASVLFLFLLSQGKVVGAPLTFDGNVQKTNGDHECLVWRMVPFFYMLLCVCAT